MEDMAVYCSWADAQLSQNQTLISSLPSELRSLIFQSTGAPYLDALARAARLPGCTDNLFALYQPVFVDLVSRWMDEPTPKAFEDDILTVSALARILPLAPYLRFRVKNLLAGDRVKIRLSTYARHTSSQLNDDELLQFLLGLFRLLSFDRDYFDSLIHPVFFSSLLRHSSAPVRYMAVQCLCQVMHFADAFSENLVKQYIGNEGVLGDWEGLQIDYRLVKLWEEKRWKELQDDINRHQMQRLKPGLACTRAFSPADFSIRTGVVGGVMVPRVEAPTTSQGSFVAVRSAHNNLQMLGKALLEHKPILLAGQAGSGKTSLILEAARLLNKQSTMITLHLNEQTDAKSLIGLYSSSSSGESFVWQPGVVTKAMQEGRWILIEDIDRAPSEVLGVLRPIIENGDLFLTARKERVKPADGFRVIATMRTTADHSRSTSPRHAWLSSARLWSTVVTASYERDEIMELLSSQYPEIQPVSAMILEVHDEICGLYQSNPNFKAAQSRLPSLRDLLKWCRRVNRRVSVHAANLSHQPVPEAFNIDIFRDAVDCYASYLNSDTLCQGVASIIAQEMSIFPQQMQHCLRGNAPAISEDDRCVKIGRTLLPKVPSKRRQLRNACFANTYTSQRALESISAGIGNSEPYLLVGETGVGKTTLVQHAADLVGQKLTVVNLSQQSEATDLLGGLKPVTTRSLILPFVDVFNTLFDDTFSASKNEKFQIALSKAVARQNWPRLLILWQEALQMADKSLKASSEGTIPPGTVPASKRRKLATPKYQNLRERWTSFSNSVLQIRGQVERGDKTHTFAFVEGRLVQAVRNGEWLLLDEINLATSDTLDHVVGLLHDGEDEQPSILLTDAGNIEQVVAHPDFRIFAAMNPATDTGKKDLMPALRSRFTELYVHPGDRDVDDLVKLIQAYLGDVLSSDKRAAPDLARAYIGLNKLNDENQLADGAGDIPHFSIRSLVRCLLYASQHSASHGLRRALYEGFAMSFFTVLSQDSESLALPLVTRHMLSNIKNVKSFLAQQPKVPHDGNTLVAFKHHLVARGPLPPDAQPHYIRTASVERNLVNLARAASMRRFPILLQGPTSTGKTSMVEYLAKLSGNVFVRINNHEHTDLQEYLGSYAPDADGKLQYKDGVLVDALRRGHWIVLDELNLAPSDVLEALNRLLDDNRELLIPESQEVVRPHSNFMLFATQNPAGLYGGRKRLSRAFRNRFLELHFDDIPEDELQIILQQRAQIAPSFCTRIVAVYKKLSLQRQSARLFEQRNSFATLRDLFRWASRPVDTRQDLADHGFMLLAERIRDPVERQTVKATIEETMKVVIDEKTLYGLPRVPSDAQWNKIIVWTSAMRRLFVLVSAALKNNEPVLLIGETGCGKTQICEVVAQVLGRNLNIYNAHTNTETGDLIGSQRPVRSRSDLATDILDNLQSLFRPTMDDQELNELDVDTLITRFNETDTSDFDSEKVRSVKAAILAYQSLFIWNDGSLVRSMKLGEHFLLDEISLADDSVLERLNSVLEPSRTILIAEKGSLDNVVVADPAFQFLATMNPGGDYGKRELSAALRNRLTEIWVPPLSQQEDILPILQAKLSKANANCAEIMLKFSLWFNSTFRSEISNSAPLRDLIAWADFIRCASNLAAEEALVHGAAMIYIDALGASPAGLSAALASDLISSRQKCLNYLQTLVQVDAASLYFDKPELRVSEAQITIGPFSMARSSSAATSAPDLVFEAPTTLRNTMRLVRAQTVGRAILLEGSPGVGKTAIVTALAQGVGKSLTRINLSDQTDIMDLFGTDAPSENERMGRFSWRDGPLLRAMQTGGWVLLDEMNLASQSVLEGLNSCLDHRKEVYVAELDKSFTCHPDFFLFAAQNPHHQGGGRKGLPASFVNRFTVVYVDPFQKDDLLCIARTKAPEIPEGKLETVIRIVFEADRLISRSPILGHGGPWEMNLRDVQRWLTLCRAYPTMNPDLHFNTVVVHRFRTGPQKSQLEALRSQVSAKSVPESFYPRLTPSSFQVGIAILWRNRERQWVDAKQCQIPVEHLPYAKSIITAVNHNWPVILSGSSGSGKTRLIHAIAAASGAELTEISMNTDIDTMDLLGGFEQFDVRRDLMACKQRMNDVLLEHVQEALMQGATEEVVLPLIEAVHICQNVRSEAAELLSSLMIFRARLPSIDHFIEQLKAIIDVSRDEKARFIWNDGILIDALVRGAWLILDNANLCNASVLDRLNSLLEPDGHLIVSEQHNAEGGTRVIKPHSNFRIFLTMDPRYGELSRAMRNRSLEIFVEANKVSQTDSEIVQYPFASRISHMRPLFASSPRDLSIDPFFDNLTFEEVELIEKQSSLPTLNYALIEDLKTKLEENHLISYDAKRVIHSLWQYLPAPGSNSSSDLGFQPQLLILNEPLFASLGESNGIDTSAALAYAWQLINDLSRFLNQLRITAQNAKSSAREQLTALEKSLIAPRKSKRISASVPPVYQFALIMCERMLVNVQIMLQDSSKIHGIKSMAPVFGFLVALVESFKAKSVDPAVFQAFLDAAHTLHKQLTKYAALIANDFGSALKLFGDVTSRRSGHGLQRMWQTWKPHTPATLTQLETKLKLEQLTVQFDGLIRRLPQPRTELAVIKTSLIRASVSAWEDTSSQTILQGLKDALERLETQSHRREVIIGHFEDVFSLLRQRFTFSHHRKLPLDVEVLSTLCGDNTFTINLFDTQNVFLKTLQELTNTRGLLDCTGDGISNLLAVALSTVKDQNLLGLDRTKEELQYLLKGLSSGPEMLANMLDAIIGRTQTMLGGVLVAHRDILTAEATILVSGDAALDIVPLACLDASQVVKKSHNDSEQFHDVYERYLRSASSQLERATRMSGVEGGENDATYSVGAALITISMAALHLVVPDRAEDPALVPALMRDIHKMREAGLQSKIDAQRRFHMQNAGQNSSMIIRLLERDMSELGEAPPAPIVVRPKVSELATVQEEFSNLLRSIVQAKPEDTLLNSKLERRLLAVESVRMNENITRVVERLKGLDRAYDDIVQPVIYILQCLGLGAEIIVSSRQVGNTNDHTEMTDHVPLLGAEPADIFSWPVNSIIEDSSMALLWLQHNSLRRALIEGARQSHMSSSLEYLRIIDKFYFEWKSRLTSDQAEAESKSRYYSYRGDGDMDEEADRDEMAELFPDFDGTSDTEPNTESKSYDGRQIAIKLARLHSDLFCTDTSASKLREYVFEVMNTISAYNSGRNDFPPAIQLLPGFLLQLDEKFRLLDGEDTISEINVHTDSSIQESQKLIKLSYKIQSRFYEIGDRWPEHAVPGEVISFCNEVLNFKLDDPVAKLLTKAERLLEIITQWQSVASREWSVTSLIDELTALIISWRRLELSSWSRLLDMEKQKNDENAKAWYFIAYEAVMVNSRRVVDDSGDVFTYCQELVKTLEEYLKASTLGQFTPRLGLLKTLNKSLKDAARYDDRLTTVSRCLSNVISHYDRYEANIEKALQVGRADLQKLVIEQIKLASWKDTNVTALRDSAKRSHNKLFRIVRKYRALLDRPISNLSSTELQIGSISGDLQALVLAVPNMSDERLSVAVQTCMKAIPGWSSRPQRLKDPLGATASMRRLYQERQSDLDVAYELASLREDVTSSITSLKAETPSTLTEENSSIVKNLKERKRRLLADTIKAVSHLGIRRNLGKIELSNQSSTAMVLASPFDLAASETAPVMQAANATFHELLDAMPRIRSALTDHSQELTEGEVRRCVGLFEGMLSVTMQQRTALSGSVQPLRELGLQMSTLRALRDATDLSLLEPSTIDAGYFLQHQLAWLPEILEISCTVLKIQAKYGNVATNDLVGEIQAHASSLLDLRSQFSSQPTLPTGLSCQANRDVQEHATTRIAKLAEALDTWRRKVPEVEFLIQQLVPWTKPIPLVQDLSANGRMNAPLNDIDNTIKSAADLVFVALQRLSEIEEKAATSVEEPRWLTGHNKYFSASLRTLRISTVVAKINAALGQMHQLKGEDVEVATSSLIVVAPILEQFYQICDHIQSRQLGVHLETCRLALILAKSFTALASDGFCSPAQPDHGQEQSGKLESGTGLGEGEGAEDISKDVGNDEDLSELAQNAEAEKEDGELENAEDAVDMGPDDLQGDMGDRDERQTDEEDGNESMDGDDDVDEETGSVDDLDPAAVDEKMWDDMGNQTENEKEMKNDKAMGKKSEEQTAAEDGQKPEDGDGGDEFENEELQDEKSDGENEEDGTGRPEAENTDPHLQEEKTLDLPDELQLNGEEDLKDDDISDDGMDELSDEDIPEDEDVKPVEVEELPDHDEVDDKPLDDGANNNESDVDGDEDIPNGAAQDDEVMEDQPVQEEEKDDGFQAREDDMQYDLDEQGGGDSGSANKIQDNLDDDQHAEGQNQAEMSAADQSLWDQPAQDDQKQGDAGKGAAERGAGRENVIERQQNEALKKLADVLDQWHQRREIMDNTKSLHEENIDKDINMADTEFEHIDGGDEGDAQALGAAANDQAQNLDTSRAIQDDQMSIEDDAPLPDVQEQNEDHEDIDARLNRLQAQVMGERREDGSYIPNQGQRQNPTMRHQDTEIDEMTDDVASDVQNLDLEKQQSGSPLTSTADATQLWSHCATATHPFSLLLTEQLRLILSPTTATKLRGDFRTGKRLNLKRIIPYIASGYKRDKIWMRRSVPSKRSYQIMIAVDDSRSMSESGADLLAFETLAMLTKSLSMLEVGDICVVGFGEEPHVRVAHPFGQPFTNESGVEVFRNFGFRQKGTDVKKLVAESITLFQDARLNSTGSTTDLWQLQLIVSDGHCSDHDAIRRLVRKAQEEKIMIVFVIVDAGKGEGESILDLKEAVFKPDPERDGEMRVGTKRYLEGFPFPYYLVVRDVRDLPGVLATALKGWFGSVVDVMG